MTKSEVYGDLIEALGFILIIIMFFNVFGGLVIYMSIIKDVVYVESVLFGIVLQLCGVVLLWFTVPNTIQSYRQGMKDIEE